MAEPYVSNIPVAVQLNKRFDIERLREDLKAAESKFRAAAQYGPYHDGSWTGISLRNADGLASSTVAVIQGAGKDTEVMPYCPYFKEIFDTLGFPVQTARLLFLPPDKKIGLHRDFFSWEDGIVRLHIPIITHEDVQFMLGEQQWHWRAGEFWFGDFNNFHSFHNQSDITRVHLVIDCYINERLLELFPEDAVTAMREEVNLGIHQDEITLSPERLEQLCGHYTVPNAITPLPLAGTIHRDGNHLEIKVTGLPLKYRFVPVEENKFTCLGFVMESVEIDGQRGFRLHKPAAALDITATLRDQKSLGQQLMSGLQWVLGGLVTNVVKSLFWLQRHLKKITGTPT